MKTSRYRFAILFSLFFFMATAQQTSAAEPVKSRLPIKEVTAPKLEKGEAVGRGYITNRIEPVEGGANLTVEVVQDRTDSAVTLKLGFDGTAYNPSGPVWVLTKGVKNPSGYITRFQFHLNYQQLIALANQKGITDAKNKIGPRKRMVVFAEFPSGHRWGGTDRNGIIVLPSPKNTNPQSLLPTKLPGFGEGTRPSALDVGQIIDSALAEQFAPLLGTGGLEVGGQIRSRVEAEGKFQLTEQDFLRIREMLFEIAEDPSQQKKILGKDWKLEVITRYMKKHRNGRLVIDEDGFPVPDPMIDTYYDTPKMDAAKNDIAIRYRWTGGNNTGTWNFKPGIGRRSPDGIVYRVEYGIDTIDDRPESIAQFANSFHPLNFFQLLRQTGATPGRFFSPSIRLTDDRYKFALTHKSGVIIEVSLDRVYAERLNGPSKRTITYWQLEMDVEHIATKVENSAPSQASGSSGKDVSPYAVMHTPKDVKPGSPTLESQAVTFELATEVIQKLRDNVIGEHWLPGAQKYAFAALGLGMIRPKTASPSVKSLNIEKVSCSDLLVRNPAL